MFQRAYVTCILFTALLLNFQVCEAAPMVELATDTESHVGKSVVHNQQICWLADGDGRYESIRLSEVKSFRELGAVFRPKSAVELRAELLKKYRGDYEVAIKGQYVVCAPLGKAKAYAELFDQVARSFSVYFSRRGFRQQSLEFPLVALVLKSQNDFLEYCVADKQQPSKLLQGYYHPHSNRVVLFDTPTLTTELSNPFEKQKGLPFELPERFASVYGGPRDTMIHEAIHQLAFNSGLHSRIGRNPRWIVEGLAMILEVDDNRANAIGSVKKRVNESRLNWFLKYRSKVRTETIAEFVADDERYFKQNVLNAYAQAWALTYFLAETRSSEYAQYLTRVSARDPLSAAYSPSDRLADFQASFGNDLPLLEVKFMRFVDSLE